MLEMSCGARAEIRSEMKRRKIIIVAATESPLRRHLFPCFLLRNANTFVSKRETMGFRRYAIMIPYTSGDTAEKDFFIYPPKSLLLRKKKTINEAARSTSAT